MLRRKVIQSILIGLCLVLLTTGGLMSILGSGGGGSSRNPFGAARFLNDRLTCGGFPFTARLTIAGRQFFSSTNSWSGCGGFTPNTYRAELFFVCGGRSFRGFANVTIQDLCTTDIRFAARGGRLVLIQQQFCPGVCPSGDFDEDVSTESGEMEYAEITFDEPISDAVMEMFKSDE